MKEPSSQPKMPEEKLSVQEQDERFFNTYNFSAEEKQKYLENGTLPERVEQSLSGLKENKFRDVFTGPIRGELSEDDQAMIKKFKFTNSELMRYRLSGQVPERVELIARPGTHGVRMLTHLSLLPYARVKRCGSSDPSRRLPGRTPPGAPSASC